MCIRDRSETAPIVPGNMLDITLLLGTKTAMLKIYDGGTEVQINDRRMSKMAGLIHLVRDHGLREEQSRFLLKRAEAEKTVRFRVKYAKGYQKKADQYTQHYDLQKGGPSSPPFPEPYLSLIHI